MSFFKVCLFSLIIIQQSFSCIFMYIEISCYWNLIYRVLYQHLFQTYRLHLHLKLIKQQVFLMKSMETCFSGEKTHLNYQKLFWDLLDLSSFYPEVLWKRSQVVLVLPWVWWALVSLLQETYFVQINIEEFD